MNLADVTPLILTYNEGPNLRDTLERLAWARRIVIVDSGSDDDTQAIAASFPQVELIEHPFDNHASQWNFGLEQVTTEWVLTLDADYKCSAALAREIERATAPPRCFMAPFRYCVAGKPLRGTLYPPRVVLFAAKEFRYLQDGHTQLLDLGNSKPGQLSSPIDHDDAKSIERWVRSQIAYALLEADKLIQCNPGSLGWKDRVRTWVVVAPALTAVYCLFAKGLILDGWVGVYYTAQRVFAEGLLSLMLLDRKVRGFGGETSDDCHPNEAH